MVPGLSCEAAKLPGSSKCASIDYVIHVERSNNCHFLSSLCYFYGNLKMMYKNNLLTQKNEKIDTI